MIPPYTAEQLSDLYNNSRTVPDYPRYLERWRSESHALRERTPYHADVAYGPQPRNRIDLFTPQGETPAPLLIFVHGGYWQYLDKHDWSCIANPYLAMGMAVAIVGYTLCPQTTVAGIVSEIEQACIHLHRTAGQYKLDRNRFHIAGHSAGGHLTAMMLTIDWRNSAAGLPARLFQSAVAVSGLFDLEPLTLTHLNAALRLTREAALQASPIFRRNAADTPLLIVVGDQETPELRRQSRDFALAWPGSEFLEAPGLNHFSVIDAFHDPASPLFERVQRHVAAEFMA